MGQQERSRFRYGERESYASTPTYWTAVEKFEWHGWSCSTPGCENSVWVGTEYEYALDTHGNNVHGTGDGAAVGVSRDDKCGRTTTTVSDLFIDGTSTAFRTLDPRGCYCCCY